MVNTSPQLNGLATRLFFVEKWHQEPYRESWRLDSPIYSKRVRCNKFSAVYSCCKDVLVILYFGKLSQLNSPFLLLKMSPLSARFLWKLEHTDILLYHYHTQGKPPGKQNVLNVNSLKCYISFTAKCNFSRPEKPESSNWFQTHISHTRTFHSGTSMLLFPKKKSRSTAFPCPLLAHFYHSALRKAVD